jgi:hypothetical protein
MFRMINKKHSVLNVVFLAEFSQKLFSQDGRSRRKQSQVQEFVGIWFDGSVQPELLAVDSDHGFVERDVIRIRIASGL